MNITLSCWTLAGLFVVAVGSLLVASSFPSIRRSLLVLGPSWRNGFSNLGKQESQSPLFGHGNLTLNTPADPLQDHPSDMMLRGHFRVKTNQAEDRQLSGTVDGDQKRRMRLQHHIGHPWPWFRVELIGTHNSYNTKADGYPFPNQDASLKKQMEAGLRLINFDVKDIKNIFGQKKLYLCHSLGDSQCNPASDRSYKDGLRDIRDFLNDPGNEREFIVLIIEDDTGKSNAPAEEMRDVFGDGPGSRLFMPIHHSSSNSGCEFPMYDTDFSREELLDQGYQLLAIFNVKDSDGGCNYKDSRFKKTIFKVPIISDKGGNTAMTHSRSPADAKIYRSIHYVVWEDRVFDWLNGGDRDVITESELARVQEFNGYNQLGLDFALKVKGRFEQAIWSWAVSEPQLTGGGTCAAIAGTHWYAKNCRNTWKAVCRKQSVVNAVLVSTWALTSRTVTFANAKDECHSLGFGWKFEPPINAYEQAQVLRFRNSPTSHSGVMWVNHYKGTDGEWALAPNSVFT